MSEKCVVECPFCDTEVELKYKGGIAFSPSGCLFGASPVSEGTCPNCGACVSAEATLLGVGGSPGIFVYATRPDPRGESAAIVMLRPDETNSYSMREGVRVP